MDSSETESIASTPSNVDDCWTQGFGLRWGDVNQPEDLEERLQTIYNKYEGLVNSHRGEYTSI